VEQKVVPFLLLSYKRIIRVTLVKESAQPSRSRIFRGVKGFFTGGLPERADYGSLIIFLYSACARKVMADITI